MAQVMIEQPPSHTGGLGKSIKIVKRTPSIDYVKKQILEAYDNNNRPNLVFKKENEEQKTGHTFEYPRREKSKKLNIARRSESLPSIGDRILNSDSSNDSILSLQAKEEIEENNPKEEPKPHVVNSKTPPKPEPPRMVDKPKEDLPKPRPVPPKKVISAPEPPVKKTPAKKEYDPRLQYDYTGKRGSFEENKEELPNQTVKSRPKKTPPSPSMIATTPPKNKWTIQDDDFDAPKGRQRDTYDYQRQDQRQRGYNSKQRPVPPKPFSWKKSEPKMVPKKVSKWKDDAPKDLLKNWGKKS